MKIVQVGREIILSTQPDYMHTVTTLGVEMYMCSTWFHDLDCLLDWPT